MDRPDRVNILLVDDQPAKLLSYEVVLAELGECLLKAHSAREALEIILKNEVAVVLTDVCMPELDGFEFAQMLREHPRYEKTAIIFISAVHLTDEDKARAYNLGAVDYVSVPVIPDILRAKVKLFVDWYRKTRDLEQFNFELERRVHERTAELFDANIRIRESEERIRLASEAAEFGTYDYHVASDSMHCSAHLKRLLGCDTPGEMSLTAFLQLVHPDHRSAVGATVLNTAIDEQSLLEVEFKTSSQAKSRWVLNRGRAVRITGANGQSLVRVAGTILDITARKALEERQKLLVAELDHRVKNILANVRAMAGLAGRKAKSVDEFVKALDGRLLAMANAHNLLSVASWRDAELMELAKAILLPFTSHHGENIAVHGEPVRIPPKVAQALALVLHELATNAVKHGALASPQGRVTLEWKQSQSSPALEILWRETGGGPVLPPKRRGLGLTIIETALSGEGVKIDCRFEPGGVACAILIGSEHVFAASSRTAPTGRAPGAASKKEVKPMRILIVEDEPLVSLQLQTDLEELGHMCRTAPDVATSWALVESDGFDAALLDFNLGHETSTPIADLLAEKQIPFALTTGYTDGALLPERLRLRPRLSKPFLIEDVSRLLSSLVEAADNAPAAPTSESPDARLAH
jgi:two-component sensor histidine kinase/DNA-binding NarL/FixJ family response regulator